MPLLIAIISIFGIATLAWLANNTFSFSICPICAGVSGTWLWILAGMYVGLLKTENWQLTAAMLMGGTVVGIAYRVENYVLSYRSLFLFKTVFIPIGFAAAYSILLQQWSAAFFFFLLLSLISFVFLSSRQKTRNSGKTVEKLKEKMKDCC